MNLRKILVLAGLAGIATGCVDLSVTNPNAADAERALRTPGDIEALIAGGFPNWWNSSSESGSLGPILGTIAYQTSATAANFGMVEFSGWPKVPAHHLPANVYYGEFSYGWIRDYRAVSAAVKGLKAIEDGDVTLTGSQLARAKAFGYFVLGLAHASTAIMYDQSYIYDPSIPAEDVELHPYGEVMTAALGYFDKAIQEIGTQTFTVPATWISRDVSSAELVRAIRSFKARYRAAVARTPTERAAVNWQQVIADVDAGITATWVINVATSSGFGSSIMSNLVRYGPWAQLSYQVLGMADTSGRYQRWLALPALSRHPNLSPDQASDPFLIITPDRRFPQGATIAEQSLAANRGTIFEIPTVSGGYGAQWNRPDRGTFRWSFYRSRANDQVWQPPTTNRTTHPEITLAEMQLLKAEALYRTNQRAAAATIINVTRTAAGLSATDANGSNTSCVPKLPNGQCGDLLEMLKWETRLNTMFYGLHMASWYFHGRGWGDLAEGAFLQQPVPGREADLLGIAAYTFGGPGGQSSAPRGTYGY